LNHSEPFLFRFKKEVIGPTRAVLESNDEIYDDSLDMVKVFEGEKWIFAIDGVEKRVTKKCDIEKGEDQKDERMWR